MAEAEFRNYHRTEVVRFRKTTEEFGGLSNMAAGFPVFVLGHRIHTSEALYQACRFPHLVDVQRLILAEVSPMTAKMRSKPFRKHSRPDWDDVRVPIMKWCLRVKLICNWDRFSGLLISTGERPIVEDSHRDDYWGARLGDGEIFSGRNVLGRLLMELRDKLKKQPDELKSVQPLPISNFALLGSPIPTIRIAPEREVLPTSRASAQR